MPDFSLGKEERIYLRSELNELFASRGSFVSYPFRVVYLKVPRQTVSIKMMVSVPKKRLKHAVDRNRIKRLAREAYRLNKHLLSDNLSTDYTLLVGFIYIGNSVRSFETTSKGITDALTKLKTLLSDDADNIMD